MQYQKSDIRAAALNKIPGPGNHVVVNTSTFDKNYQGIVLVGADLSEIIGSTFIIPHKGLAGIPFLGIYSDGSAGLIIDDNNYSSATSPFTPPDYNRGAVISNTTGVAASFERHDNFIGVSVASQAQGDNSNLQIRCNAYNSPELYSVVLADGGLPSQGSCQLEPAGNLWDLCINTESHLFKNQAASGYTYSAHSDRVPFCVSQDIIVNDCDYNYNFKPTCEATPPCNPCEDFPEGGEIAGREVQKQFWASSTLPPEEIADIVWQLTWEQKIIAQRGLVRVVEDDPTLIAAFEYLEEVGAAFPFPPNDRIGLYLSSGNLTAANNLIAALPASNEKTLFSLFSTLQSEGRSFKQITTTEEQTVRTIAQGNDQAAARAKSILFAAFGESIEMESEPLDGGGRPALETVETQTPVTTVPVLTFAPNPTSEVATVRYTLVSERQQATFVLLDVYGRQVLRQRLPADVLNGELTLNLSDLPYGTYIGAITVEGQRQAISRLTIVK